MWRGKPREQSQRGIRVNSDDVLKPAVVFRCLVTLDWVAVALSYSPLMWANYFLFLTDSPLSDFTLDVVIWAQQRSLSVDGLSSIPIENSHVVEVAPVPASFSISSTWRAVIFTQMCSNASNTNHTQSCSRARVYAVTLSKQQQQVFSSIITCRYVKNAIICFTSVALIIWDNCPAASSLFPFQHTVRSAQKNCAGMLWERSPTPEETNAGLIGAIVTRWARG